MSKNRKKLKEKQAENEKKLLDECKKDIPCEAKDNEESNKDTNNTENDFNRELNEKCKQKEITSDGEGHYIIGKSEKTNKNRHEVTNNEINDALIDDELSKYDDINHKISDSWIKHSQGYKGKNKNEETESSHEKSKDETSKKASKKEKSKRNKPKENEHNGTEVENKKVKDTSNIKSITSYKIFKNLLMKYDFKCLDEKIYVYIEDEGKYRHFNDNYVRILIREGWDEDVNEKLNRNNMLEIIERIKTEPSIQIDDNYFNCNYHMMNFLNGVLDLLTGEFMNHSPKFRFTHCIHANYESYPMGGETFEKFIEIAMQGDEEKKMHLQEIVGYMLSEFCTAKKVPLIVGKPHSGKSTLNRIISTLIGKDEVANVPLHRLHERFMLAHISTKKVNICSEISDEALSYIEVFKAITGNDEMVAEYKGKDPFTFKSKIKLLFSGNCMPVLKNQDITTAFFDRLTFINFNYTVPEEERDHNLENKLLDKERSYIVNWAVEGIQRLMRNNFIFSESWESIKFKEKYIKEQNNTLDFVESNCEIGKNSRIHLKDLYAAYLMYCHQNCFTAYSKEDFFTQVSKNAVKKKKFRINGSNPLWGYVGIGLKKESS